MYIDVYDCISLSCSGIKGFKDPNEKIHETGKLESIHINSIFRIETWG